MGTVEIARHEIVANMLASAQRDETGHEAGKVLWHSWGEGPPLVLLHGSHGGWMHWIRNIGELSQTRRVIVPDLPGFGESDPPADLDSPIDHAAPIADGLIQLQYGNEPIDFACFSLGALLGCFVSILRPELVRRLILVDAGGLGTPVQSADFRPMRGTSPDERREVNRHNLGAMMLHDPARIDDLAIDISMLYGPRVRTKVQYHVIPDNLLSAVRRVTAPIDLIWGEHDFPHPGPEMNADALRAIQPGCQLRIVEDAGHWSMYEQPERFNAALLDLLRQPPRQS